VKGKITTWLLALGDYALIGDTQTAALVGRNGSVVRLCLPRFDSGACFAALLGQPRHGRRQNAPANPAAGTRRRRYRSDTLIMETEFEADGGSVRLVDFMTPRESEPGLIRIVQGVRGTVRSEIELINTARSLTDTHKPAEERQG
jgi:GH15 family glucan-1,4-alpha-glucosidase